MLWGLIAVGLGGILLGLRFRAPALMAATGVTAVSGLIFGGMEGHALVATLVFVFALQGAYLVGLGLALLWRAGEH